MGTSVCSILGHLYDFIREMTGNEWIAGWGMEQQSSQAGREPAILWFMTDSDATKVPHQQTVSLYHYRKFIFNRQSLPGAKSSHLFNSDFLFIAV